MSAEDEDRELLLTMWAGASDRLLARVDAVDAAVAGLVAGTLDDEVRATALGEAHKLAGSLGTFGVPEGSRLAREIEHALADRSAELDPVALGAQAAALRAVVNAGPA